MLAKKTFLFRIRDQLKVLGYKIWEEGLGNFTVTGHNKDKREARIHLIKDHM